MTESALLMWGTALLGAAVLLVIVEILIPSGGLIGAVALLVAIAGLVMFYRVSLTWGLASTLATMIAAPAAVGFAFKIYPNTYIGKRLILSDLSEEEKALQLERKTEERRMRQALVGARGKALTDLRPVGTVEIDGERLDALAVGGVIDAGSSIKVISVEDNQVKVRAAV